MWVSNLGFGTVAKLASDGSIAGSNGLNRSASTGIAFDGANIWVADYNYNTVSQLRASDGVVLRDCAVGVHPLSPVGDKRTLQVRNVQILDVRVSASLRHCQVLGSKPSLDHIHR